MTMRRFTLQCATLGSVALGSYLIGSNTERTRMKDTLQNVLNTDKAIIESIFINNGPKITEKFSLFESVSAATPFSAPESIATGPSRVLSFSL